MIGKDLIVGPSVKSLLRDLELFFGYLSRTEIFHAQDLERWKPSRIHIAHRNDDYKH
jgi:hypothetical protein